MNCIFILKNFFSFHDKNCDISHNGEYSVLTFFLKNKEYKLCFKRKRGIKQIISVYDDLDNDITEEVFKYMGPYHDFFSIKTNPNMLGYNNIKILYRNGEIINYNENETINLVI